MIFDAPVEAVRIASEKALRSLGWEIDTDRSTPGEGVFVTESRGLNFQDFGVYGEGLRHRLHVLVKPDSGGNTSVLVRRELYHEKRILWNKEQTAVQPQDTSIESSLLDAIRRLL